MWQSPATSPPGGQTCGSCACDQARRATGLLNALAHSLRREARTVLSVPSPKAAGVRKASWDAGGHGRMVSRAPFTGRTGGLKEAQRRCVRQSARTAISLRCGSRWHVREGCTGALPAAAHVIMERRVVPGTPRASARSGRLVRTDAGARHPSATGTQHQSHMTKQK